MDDAMTVAIYDSLSLVTDGMTTWGNMPLKTHLSKGMICGSWVIVLAGDMPAVLPIRAALEDKKFGPDELPVIPGAPTDDSKWEALAIGPDRLCWYCKTPHPVELDMSVIGIGSGMDLAMGAVAAGADALTAARIAADYDLQCRPPYYQYTYVPKAGSWKEERHDA
jgi:hypothetical protein